MSPDKPTILLVDDDKQVLRVLEHLFSSDYATLLATSGSEAVNHAKSCETIAVAVMDIKMPRMDGITAGRLVREANPSIRIIFHTGYPGDYEEEQVDESERPFDYIEKGRSSIRLIRSVRNAVNSHLVAHSPTDLLTRGEVSFGMIGRSRGMAGVFELIEKVARADNKVMILGETGTGKELVARAIHTNSRRREQRLGIVNCNHKSTELVGAELFGYKKGAFTGADTDRRGLFEIADGGTVFLDEIGDLSETTQIALLRVLETGEFQQLGPEADVKQTDIRVVCATHRDLGALVKEGRFREDLYYRLRGATITLPPLRERREDIPILIEKFRDQFTIEKGLPFKVFDVDAVKIMIAHTWPGNVRELLDTVEALIVLSDSELILASDVRRHLDSTENSPSKPGNSLSERLQDLERTLIIQALVQTECNISAASIILGVERSNLSKKIKNLGIDPPSIASQA